MDISNIFQWLSTLSLDRGTSIIIATIAGAFIAGFFTTRSFKHQTKLLQQQLESQRNLFIEELKSKTQLAQNEYNEKNKENRKQKIEQIYELLSTIKTKCSITSSFISTEIDDIESFHKFYINEITSKINKIDMLTGLYFPELSESISKINSQANLFWGYQQQYLRQQEKGQHSESDMANVNKSANEILALARKMQYKLSTEFKKLEV